MKFIFFITFLFVSLSVRAQDHGCQIYHKMITPEGNVNTTWQFFIKQKSGVIKLDGILYDEKIGDSTISREIFFDVEKFSEQGYQLTSQQIIKNPAEKINDAALAKYYPDFFVYENRKVMFTINRSGKSFVMSWSTDPMFYCY